MHPVRRAIAVSLLAFCAAWASPVTCIADDNLPAAQMAGVNPDNRQMSRALKHLILEFRVLRDDKLVTGNKISDGADNNPADVAAAKNAAAKSDTAEVILNNRLASEGFDMEGNDLRTKQGRASHEAMIAEGGEGEEEANQDVVANRAALSADTVAMGGAGAKVGQSDDDLDGLRQDYNANKGNVPTTMEDLGKFLTQLRTQYLDQPYLPSNLWESYTPINTEGMAPDGIRCGNDFADAQDCHDPANNSLGCERNSKNGITSCYLLWGIQNTKLYFITQMYKQRNSNEYRFANFMTVRYYRQMKHYSDGYKNEVNGAIQQYQEMLLDPNKLRCALSTNGTTGSKTPGCP